jgi:hypothetical protein
MALESSLRGLQVWFRSRPDRRSGRGATKSQSPEKKSHSDATPVGERRVYYREYGGGISRVRAVVCHVSLS